MYQVVRWLVVPLATAAVVLLIAQISAQFSSTNVEIQLAVTARIDDQDRLEFGVIPPGGASADRLLPRARFLAWDQVQDPSGWRSSSPVDVRVGQQTGETIVVRVVARATGDETVEFGLQQQSADRAWGERILPPRRLFPLTGVASIWLRSRFVTVDVSNVGLSDCTIDQPLAIGRGCRYPGSDEVFAVDLRGRGTYRGESAPSHLQVRFNVGTAFHQLQAESERDVWRITGLGVLPLCTRDQLVTLGQTCDHPGTGEEFSVARDGSATFRGWTYQSGTIQLADFEAVRNDRITGWTMTRVAAPPRIEAIRCSPSNPMVGEVVSCTAESNALFDAHSWSAAAGSPRRSSAAEYVTTFGNARDITIRLSATAVTGGEATSTAILRVHESPAVHQIICTPAEPAIGMPFVCQAHVTGLASSLSWYVDDVLVRSGVNQLITTLDQPGEHQLRFVADSGRGPSDEDDVTLNARVTAVLISAGHLHTCALDSIGHLDCWGGNGEGQTDVPSGRFKQVSAGIGHTCAVNDQDRAVCWGENHRSDRSYAGQSDPPSDRFLQVTAASNHSCGITLNKTVKCWGTYTNGGKPQLDGAFAQIDASSDRTCGVTTDGPLRCDGASSLRHSPTPAGDYAHVSVGGNRACGILLNDTVFCWLLSVTNNQVPTPGESQKFLTVSVAPRHTCAITVDQEPFFDDGEVICWQHRLMDFTHNKGQTIPPDERFVDIASGTFHTCGIKTNGKVVCWGDGRYGQLDVPERFADP